MSGEESGREEIMIPMPSQEYPWIVLVKDDDGLCKVVNSFRSEIEAKDEAKNGAAGLNATIWVGKIIGSFVPAIPPVTWRGII
jgi:hypothetical protein